MEAFARELGGFGSFKLNDEYSLLLYSNVNNNNCNDNDAYAMWYNVLGIDFDNVVTKCHFFRLAPFFNMQIVQKEIFERNHFK